MVIRSKSAAIALAVSLSGMGMLVDAVTAPARAVTLCSLTAGLFGCAAEKPSEKPTFYRSLANPDEKLDAAAAVSMISGYRRNNGLNALTLDPKLMKIAETHAQAMASRNTLDHNVGGPFSQRMRRSGFDAKVAVENIGAGYHTLAEAFSGWRDSPPHRANMLRSGVTKMGIATAYSPNSKYRVFWAMVLAAPDDQRQITSKNQTSSATNR